MIDSHCHLNFKAFNNDWQQVAERAFAGGVKGIVNVGSNLETSQRAVEISNNFPLNKGEHKGVLPNLYAAIGLHPIHVADEEFDISKYEDLIKQCHCEEQSDVAILSSLNFKPLTLNSCVVAIGETGIDLYHNSKNIDQQREVFIESIYLANINKLPVIIHNRQAGEEILEVLENHQPRYGGVMHFFSENFEYAQKLFDMGILISFTGAITLNNVDDITIEVIKKAPLDKILIETDAPYVVPRRQKNKKIKRNEPAFVVEVAQKIAEIKNIDLAEVESQTTQNTIDLFNLK